MQLRGGYYYLFIGPDYETLVRSHRETGRYDMAAYRRTRVLVSEDPLAFRLDQQIATVPSHALEVVVDEQQQYWVPTVAGGRVACILRLYRAGSKLNI